MELTSSASRSHQRESNQMPSSYGSGCVRASETSRMSRSHAAQMSPARTRAVTRYHKPRHADLAVMLRCGNSTVRIRRKSALMANKLNRPPCQRLTSTRARKSMRRPNSVMFLPPSLRALFIWSWRANSQGNAQFQRHHPCPYIPPHGISLCSETCMRLGHPLVCALLLPSAIFLSVGIYLFLPLFPSPSSVPFQHAQRFCVWHRRIPYQNVACN